MSYDIFLTGSNDLNGEHTYEIMIWLGRLGNATPLGSVVDTATIGGILWNLWQGKMTDASGSWTVYSFVADEDHKDYPGNLHGFLSHLTDSKKVPSSGQYIQKFQSGVEAFTGTNASFATSPFTISVYTTAGQIQPVTAG